MNKREKLYRHLRIKWLSGFPRGTILNVDINELHFNFTKEFIIEGIKELGVNYDAIPTQRKWFQFWKNETNMKIEYAINLIP